MYVPQRLLGGLFLAFSLLLAGDATAQCEISEQQSLHQILTGDYADFGAEVAVDGDVLAVAGNEQVEIFRWDGSRWVAEQRLEETHDYSVFGTAIDVSGDVLVIGSEWDDEVAWNAGAAFVYRFNGTEWVFEQKITAEDSEWGDRLGSSVAVEKNVIVLGVPDRDEVGTSHGAVYVFDYHPVDPSPWTLRQKIWSSDPDANDSFGWNLDLKGELLVVGASLDDESCPEEDPLCSRGAAYVFREVAGEFIEEQKLMAWDEQEGYVVHFGRSVGVDGDVVAVGAPWNDGREGAVYVYRYNGSEWLPEEKLKDIHPEEYDYAGWEVEVAGNSILMGIAGEEEGDKETGAVLLYRHDGEGWILEKNLIPSLLKDHGGLGNHPMALQEDRAFVGTPNTSQGQGENFKDGFVNVFAVPAFALSVNPVDPKAEEMMDFTVCGAVPDSLIVLALTQIDQQPLFHPFIFGVASDEGSARRTFEAPAGAEGLEITLQAFGFSEYGGMITPSNPTLILFP